MHEPEELVMGLRAISAYMDLQKNEAAGQVYCLTRSFFSRFLIKKLSALKRSFYEEGNFIRHQCGPR